MLDRWPFRSLALRRSPDVRSSLGSETLDMTVAQQPASQLLARLRQVGTGGETLFVGIDGRSGAGKSTLAAAVCAGLTDDHRGGDVVTVIDGDQFYAGGSAESWDGQTPAMRASRVIDWRRQRAVLEQLRHRGIAGWYPFDWEADDWDSDIVPLARERVVATAGSLVTLEGAYSCRPELHDVLDLPVLLDTPRAVRRQRLLECEGEAYRSEWEARWSVAEEYYFGRVMPPSRFDLVLGRSDESTHPPSDTTRQ